jgi:hypothetical protein
LATDLSLAVGTAACRHCATPLAGRFCHACGIDSAKSLVAIVLSLRLA